MNSLKKVIRNIIIILFLSILFIMRTGLYLSPLSAHESAERKYHYGPSEVVHIEDNNGAKYFLCKYDRWVSCNKINRVWLFFWSAGYPNIFENDKMRAVEYSWESSDQNYKAYGIINDDRITKIEIALPDGSIYTQTEFYDNLFLFTWKSSNYGFKYIKGYDKDNNIIFEEQVIG